MQAERCEDADIIMLANMPLSREAIERASHLQYIDVAFTGVDHIPMDEAGKRELPSAMLPGMQRRLWQNFASVS